MVILRFFLLQRLLQWRFCLHRDLLTCDTFDAFLEKVKEVDTLIGGNGRVLLRQSGTEPVIRIMIETESIEKCHDYADKIADVVKERGYLDE